MDHYRAIEQLLYRYAENIDGGDFDALARMFDRGAVVSLPSGWRLEGYSALKEFYQRQIIVYPQTGTPCTSHQVSNVVVELNAQQDRAAVRSLFVVRQALEGREAFEVMSGRYSDHLAFDGVRWYFTERKILPVSFGDLTCHFRGQLDRTPAAVVPADNVVAFAGGKRPTQQTQG